MTTMLQWCFFKKKAYHNVGTLNSHVKHYTVVLQHVTNLNLNYSAIFTNSEMEMNSEPFYTV